MVLTSLTTAQYDDDTNTTTDMTTGSTNDATTGSTSYTSQGTSMGTSDVTTDQTETTAPITDASSTILPSVTTDSHHCNDNHGTR